MKVEQTTKASPNQGYAATGRTREHLVPSEIDQLLTAAKHTVRNGLRNYVAILLAYRHGLRVGELVGLRWSDVDFEGGTILVRRLKGSKSGNHPLCGDELRALRKLARQSAGIYILASSKGIPLATSAVASMVGQTHTQAESSRARKSLSHPACRRLALIPPLAEESWRSRLSAIWRTTARLAGAWSLRIREASSWKATSRTQ